MSHSDDVTKKLNRLLTLAAIEDHDWDACALIQTLATAAKADSNLADAFITKGLEVLPAVAAQNSTTAYDLVATLAIVAGAHPNLAATFITKGLEVLPVVAVQSHAAGYLATELLTAARGTPELATVITKSLEVLPTVAAKDSGPARYIAESLANAVGIDDDHQGFVCKEFMLSAKVAPENFRTLVVFGATPESSVVGMVFRDINLSVLRTIMAGNRRMDRYYQNHYQGVLDTAFGALANRAKLPSFAGQAVTQQAHSASATSLRLN
jgi:hypothetical protein